MLAALTGLTRAGHAQTITTIDVPGARDTMPSAINAFGEIVGSYVDANSTSHGFVRSPFGTITTFDAPSIGDSSTGYGTEAAAVNFAGQVVGSVRGVSSNVLIERGFVRTAFGAITEFDAAPGALRTEAQAINPEGWIAGLYFDAAFVGHGYVRLAHGAVTTFDVPGLMIAVRQIRPNGEVIGVNIGIDNVFHGFTRELDGALTSFSAPDVDLTTGGVFCGHCGGTFPTAANALGRTVGYYGGAARIIHGFLRKPDGAFSVVDAPAAIRSMPEAINLEGDIAGEYTDATPLGHGFIQPRNGALESFDVSGGTNLRVTGIGVGREVIGYYWDSSGDIHGFIRTPRAVCEHRR
jgi:hypothetical protein